MPLSWLSSSMMMPFVLCWATSFVTPSNAFQQSLAIKNRSWGVPIQPSMVRGGEGQDMGTGELTSALARLDEQWQIQQKGKKNRWTKLVLNTDNDVETTEGEQQQQEEEFVYLLEPESSFPSCLILFAGGAGLGQFPHIAYSTFLERLSTRLNAAVLAAPYQVGLDHFALAKQSGELLRRAIIQCEDDPTREYSPDLPKYCLAHSLGAKLQTIYMAATGQDYDGIGFLSFNNYGFAQTITMARSFAQQLRSNWSAEDGTSEFQTEPGEDILNTIFNFAENVVGAIGFEFSPSPTDMDRLIETKYDAKYKGKTRLFRFDDDTLDNSREFFEMCSRAPDGGSTPSVSALPGTHLTPVYFKFGLEDLPEEVPREMAVGAIGGMESASFGNEEELNLLVDEVCNWILGKGPSREPSWDEQSAWQGQRRITGGVVDADVE